MKGIRYNRFHLLLDIFGLAGVILTILFYTKGHALRLRNEELYNLWVAFAAGIVTLWVGVRIIEYLIRKNEKTTSARIRIVRNMRFLVQKLRNHAEYPRRGDFEQLTFEFNWAQKMFNNYRRAFRADEIKDVNSFYAQLGQALPHFGSLLQAKTDADSRLDSGDREAARADSRKKFDTIQQELWSFMPRLEEARMTAEKNILKETEEEWL
jgi:hypothetical protein